VATLPRHDPALDIDLFPHFNPLNQEVEALKVQLETLRIHNEITSPKFRAQCRAALKTPDFPSFSSRLQKDRKVDVEIDNSRPSSVSDADRTLLSSAEEETQRKPGKK